ncbi:MAG: ribbon-helix-helix protein, CopG family [Thermoguttaceae bacterium]|nr:ribbon-helix-helix protein, CopG family [Thermoguttaceae bacterium]
MSIFDRDETPVRVSFTLPRYMLEDLDEYAETAKKSRAALLRSILRAELNAVDLDGVRRFANVCLVVATPTF